MQYLQRLRLKQQLRRIIALILTGTLMVPMCGMKAVDSTTPKTDAVVQESKIPPVSELDTFIVEEIATPEIVEEEPAPEPEPVYDMQLSKTDIDLIALVTMAEAEGESEYGKRLVIDTILNRVDSEHFPDTVYGVIYQANQFSSMWDGRASRCYVMDDIVKLVEEELQNRKNGEVMFFTAGAYGAYGTPMFQVGGHYFASY